VVIGLIIGLRITADQQRPEQTGGRRCETIRTGETDNSPKKCRMFVETAPRVFTEMQSYPELIHSYLVPFF
jgi:hypothetical protein